MCSLCRLPVATNHNFGQILIFGSPCTDPLLPMRAKFSVLEQTHGVRLPDKISSRSVYSVVLWRRNPPIFAVFWTSVFSDVANCHQSQKLEHGCTTTNLPLSNGIKIVSVLQRLHGEIRRTISDVQKRDIQTDKLTKNSTFLAAPAVGEIRAPPNLAW